MPEAGGGAQPEGPARVLLFGPFELDLERSDLRKDGKPVEIQSTPLRVLAYLATHPGEVISRDELLERVWDGSIVSDNAVSTALKHVRQALEDRDRESPWVETLRGRGFRFNAPLEGEVRQAPAESARLRTWLGWIALLGAWAAVTAGLLTLTVWLSWPAPLGLLLDLTGFGEPLTNLPLPDKPSVVVLPFANMSDDAQQVHFSDGITEDLTTDLARNPTLLVISRNSAFTYKDKSVDIRQVGRELGVGYAVEGSVRRAADQIRITAQLIDTRTGGHVWSQRYDRELDDIFELQSEVAWEIQRALRSEIESVESRTRWRRGTDDLLAYEEFLRADALVMTMERQNIVVEARRHLERAIELDPGYSTAHALLASTYWMEFGVAWSQDLRLVDRAEELARRAIELDPESGDGLESLSSILILRGRLPEALEAADRAVAINPNLAVAHLVRAPALALSGRYLAAFRSLQTVARLDPHSTALTTAPYAWANLAAGRIPEAMELFERASGDYSDLVIPRVNLAAYYEAQGKHEEAATRVREILRVVPEFTARWGAAFVDEQVCDDIEAMLIRAGLPRG